jgi:DNA invertase Pin-like site-specific DNA recombinase
MDIQEGTSVAYLRAAALSPRTQQVLQRQLSDCEHHAQGIGLRISRIYVDAGESGNRADRPALRSLLHEIRPRRIKRVIVADSTRLARSCELERSLLRAFARRGVVVSIAEAHVSDLTTEGGVCHKPL